MERTKRVYLSVPRDHNLNEAQRILKHAMLDKLRVPRVGSSAQITLHLQCGSRHHESMPRGPYYGVRPMVGPDGGVWRDATDCVESF